MVLILKNRIKGSASDESPREIKGVANLIFLGDIDGSYPSPMLSPPKSKLFDGVSG